MKKILKWIVSISILILVILIIIINWTAKDDLRMINGYSSAIVLSDSMNPTFYKDDLIVIKKKDDYQVGDIVVFKNGSDLIVHRIINIKGDIVTTKGDANNVYDDSITISQIKGCAIGYIPHIGKIIKLLKSHITLILIISILIATQILNYIKKIRHSNLINKNYK